LNLGFIPVHARLRLAGRLDRRRLRSSLWALKRYSRRRDTSRTQRHNPYKTREGFPDLTATRMSPNKEWGGSLTRETSGGGVLGWLVDRDYPIVLGDISAGFSKDASSQLQARLSVAVE